MRYLFLLLFIVSVSCKKEEAKRDKPSAEAKITTDVLQPVSDAEAVRNAVAYEKSLAFTPKFLSEIDRLATEEDVEKLIHRLDTSYRLFEVKAISAYDRGSDYDSILQLSARRLGVRKSFYKYDLDGNGYTDLVVTGDDHHCTTANDAGIEITCDYTCLAIMGSATGAVLKKLNAKSRNQVVPVIVPNGRGGLVRMHDYNRVIWRNIMIKDTSTVALTYLKDVFVEHNPKPVFHAIEKIEYFTSPCYGTCPVFQLTLTEDKTGYFIPKLHNFSDDYDGQKDEGFFTTSVASEKYNEITALLTYLDFENLDDYYSLSSTDHPGCTLRITYDNGHVKEIGNYGQEGTYGLMKVYQLLADLRFNQKWLKTKEVYGIQLESLYDI